MRATLALAATAALVVASCGGGGSTATTDGVDTDPTSPAITVSPDDTSTSDTTPGTTPGTTPAALGVEVGQVGFTTAMRFDRLVLSAAAELTNTSSTAVGNVKWTAELLDSSGVLLDDASGWFSGTLLPGETAWLLPTFQLEEGGNPPASVRVELVRAEAATEVVVENGTAPLDQSTLEQVSALAYTDINDATHVEAVFHNPGDARLTTISALCGLYVDDTLVAGTYAFVNEILPGGNAGLDMVSNLVPFESLPTDVRCWAGAVNNSTYEPGGTGSGLEVQAGVTYNPAGGDGKFHDTIVGVTVHNPTDQAAFGVQIEVDLIDADGRIVHVAAPSSTYVLPGETLHTGIMSVMSLDSAPAASAVARTSVELWGDPTNASLGSQEGLDLTARPFTVTGPQAYLSSTGMLIFGGTVTNMSADPMEDAVISCSALQGGVPVAGQSWTLGETLAGQPRPFEIITGFRALPAHDTVECNVHLTSITTIG